MKVVYSQDQTLHQPTLQVIQGEQIRYPETPDRVIAILEALSGSTHKVVEPVQLQLESLYSVHSPAYVRFIVEQCSELYNDEHFEFLGSRDEFIADEYVAVTLGTGRAALASASSAVAGARLIREGERAVYALCRPPGHHAGPDYCGGFCFLNNAALAANALTQEGARVSILDIDYHHGNGTQEIFYESDAVQFVSIHSDPEFEYPYRAGFVDEVGRGRGRGFNVNLPIRRGANELEYFAALSRGLEQISRFGPDALVVSFGADICRGDPEGSFDLDPESTAGIGDRIAGTGLPRLVIQEGGYAPSLLSDATRVFLESIDRN